VQAFGRKVLSLNKRAPKTETTVPPYYLSQYTVLCPKL